MPRLCARGRRWKMTYYMYLFWNYYKATSVSFAAAVRFTTTRGPSKQLFDSVQGGRQLDGSKLGRNDLIHLSLKPAESTSRYQKVAAVPRANVPTASAVPCWRAHGDAVGAPVWIHLELIASLRRTCGRAPGPEMRAWAPASVFCFPTWNRRLHRRCGHRVFSIAPLSGLPPSPSHSCI